MIRFLRSLCVDPPVETHISLVFLGLATAWKLKKAVRLPFLDFSTLATRRQLLHRELALNAPMAPGLYQDVVAVAPGVEGGLDFFPDHPAPLDWVLRMARVPAADFLDAVAARGDLTPALQDALGDAVAAFHAGLAPVHGVGAVAALIRVAAGNVVAAREAGLPGEVIDSWHSALLAALDRARPALEAREAAGLVRRAHGDLHLGNLCLWQGRPVPFDALEFDEALATIDLGYDLAFLLMDLDQRVGRPAANRVMNRYLARTGDHGLVVALAPFLSLRAMVRAHVEARLERQPQGGGRAASGTADLYLAAARAYLRPAPPAVVAVGGLPGAGKSTLARALAPFLGAAPGAVVLRSDEIRKRQHGVAPETRLGSDAYSPEASRAVFAELAATAGAIAAAGHSVVADATFMAAADRAAIAAAAAASGCPFLGVWLQVPPAVLRGRVAGRSLDASDATVEVVDRAVAADPGAGDWLAVDATDAAAAFGEVIARIRAFTSRDTG